MFVSQNIKENNVNIQINKQILENKKLNKRLLNERKINSYAFRYKTKELYGWLRIANLLEYSTNEYWEVFTKKKHICLIGRAINQQLIQQQQISTMSRRLQTTKTHKRLIPLKYYRVL